MAPASAVFRRICFIQETESDTIPYTFFNQVFAVMQEKAFESWLTKQNKKSYHNYISRIRRIEKYYGDIDIAFDKDECESLLKLFEYSQDDLANKREPKHCIPSTPTTEEGRFRSIYEGASDYRTRIKNYIAFRRNADIPYQEDSMSKESIRSNDRLNIPLNQIFYGPPGTGKTHKTITAALEILQPGGISETREEQKADFDSWVEKGRIRFVTFHQSFSYEDFVEGIKAQTVQDESDTRASRITYDVVDGLFKQLCHDARHATEPEPYVLIIDEINRGNISNIFGELITLVEPSKREGAPESLTVQLPYSKERFSIPNTVYIIGTMNTADRSLTGIDIALRRRFQFTELAPEPELLKDVTLCGTNVSVGDILRIMNERIAILLDRDHCMGHAYFFPLCNDCTLEKLKNIFRQNILPLLQEYFFDDWQKIHWVLNDHKKKPCFRFVYPKSIKPEIFDEEILSQVHSKNWEIQKASFDYWESYLGIFDISVVYQTDSSNEYDNNQNIKKRINYKSKDGYIYTFLLNTNGGVQILKNNNYVGYGKNTEYIRKIAEEIGYKLKEGNTRAIGRELIDILEAMANNK